MNKIRIAVVIPTFNRKELLIQCLEAVSNQTLKPQKIFVMDNNSADGTGTLLEQLGYKNEINDVLIKYVNLGCNGGGALGFSEGMRLAHEEASFDAYWMLDDDGLPAPNCLEELCKYINQYDYVVPIVFDIANRNKLCGKYLGCENLEELQKQFGNNKLLKGYCNPFNGGLFSNKLVNKVGYPKKELFIYGDETNYHERSMELGFISYGICNAIHFHPAPNHKQWTYFKSVRFRPVEWNMVCVIRNSVYNMKIRFSKKPIETTYRLFKFYCYHVIFFVFKKPSLYWFVFFNRSYMDGLFERWGREKKYLG